MTCCRRPSTSRLPSSCVRLALAGVLVAGFLVAARDASAQTPPPIGSVFTVPFTFHAGKELLTAEEGLLFVPENRAKPGSRTIGLHFLRTVSYTHLRAHETRHDLVCRLLLEK